jgi:hypothetical protein
MHGSSWTEALLKSEGGLQGTYRPHPAWELMMRYVTYLDSSDTYSSLYAAATGPPA